MNVHKPDAIRSPLSHSGGGSAYARLAKLQAEFSALLQTATVFVRHQGTEHFITGSADDTLNFECHGARVGEARYEWKNRGDGVLLGTLKPHG